MSTAATSLDWKAFNQQILDALDLESEFRALGLVTHGRPNQRGWVCCLPLGRTSGSYSAGVNLGTEHPARGRYKEFVNDGRNLSFFDLAAEVRGDANWEVARDRYAARVGISPPTAKRQRRPEDLLTFRDWNQALVATWCSQHRAGILPGAVRVAGARLASWPTSKRFNVVALPIFGPSLLDDDPTGWVIWNLSGQPLPLFQGKDQPPKHVKMLTVGGSVSGLMNAFGIRHLEQAEYVWLTEGPSDMLALQSFVPKAEFHRHAVCCFSGGAMELETLRAFGRHFAGKRIFVLGDGDRDGFRGAARKADLLAQQASECRNPRLPLRLVEKHGHDLRDLLNGSVRPCGVCGGTGNRSRLHTSLEEAERSVWSVGDCPTCGGTGIDPAIDAKLPHWTFESFLEFAVSVDTLSVSRLPINRVDQHLGNGHAGPAAPAAGQDRGRSSASPASQASATAEQAETATPIAGGYQRPNSDDLIFENMLCEDLRIAVIGEVQIGRQNLIRIWSLAHRKAVDLSPKQISYEDLLTLCGPVAKARVHVGKDDVPGMYRLQQVREAIGLLGGFRKASDGKGQGCWLGQPGLTVATTPIVLVGSGESLVWSGDSVTRHESPVADGIAVDIRSESPWFCADTLSHYLERSRDPQWCADTVERLIILADQWYWKQKMAPEIIAGLVLSTWLQTLWRWRPMVSIVGASDSGKTTFFKFLSNLFGNLSLLSSKSSEAGLRQAIGNTGCVVLCDEFESDKHRRQILEFFRTASQGSRTLRGTMDQDGQAFGLRHICWVAAVEVGMDREPDRNRFISLELKAPPAERRGKLVLPPPAELADLGQRLLAVAMRNFRLASEYAEQLQGVVIEGVHGRIVESMSVPAAILSATIGTDLAAATNGTLPNMIRSFDRQDLTEQSERDEVSLIQAILGAWVDIGRGERKAVSQIIESAVILPDDLDALGRHGLSITTDRATGNRSLFIEQNAVKRTLLRGTPWEYQSLNQIVGRIPGARRGAGRAAGRVANGVAVPMIYIQQNFFGECDDGLES